MMSNWELKLSVTLIYHQEWQNRLQNYGQPTWDTYLTNLFNLQKILSRKSRCTLNSFKLIEMINRKFRRICALFTQVKKLLLNNKLHQSQLNNQKLLTLRLKERNRKKRNKKSQRKKNQRRMNPRKMSPRRKNLRKMKDMISSLKTLKALLLIQS